MCTAPKIPAPIPPPPPPATPKAPDLAQLRKVTPFSPLMGASRNLGTINAPSLIGSTTGPSALGGGSTLQ